MTIVTDKIQNIYFTKVFLRHRRISTKAFGTPEDKNNTQVERERKTASLYKVHTLTLSKGL